MINIILETLASERRQEKEIKAWVGQKKIKFLIYRSYDLATYITQKNLLYRKKQLLELSKVTKHKSSIKNIYISINYQ